MFDFQFFVLKNIESTKNTKLKEQEGLFHRTLNRPLVFFENCYCYLNFVFSMFSMFFVFFRKKKKENRKCS